MRELFLVAIVGGLLSLPATAQAEPRTLQDYRYFRSLSIDLNGRMPTREEVAQLSREDFDLSAWIDARLQSPTYAMRIRRIYTDALRLELNKFFQIGRNAIALRRHTIKGPNGADMHVYYRAYQRRSRPETDGTFCLTKAETGLSVPSGGAATGTPIPVSQAALDAHTRFVRPWWLYRDYRSSQPSDRYDESWADMGFVLSSKMLLEPDMTTATTAVRVCKEEASSAESGTVFATGRTTTAGAPVGRVDQPPLDSAYAREHAGESIPCGTSTAFRNTLECGCGVGLERCMPMSYYNSGGAVIGAETYPLGQDAPLSAGEVHYTTWERVWWSQEAEHFLDYIVSEDRDFREVLTAKYTVVNGPLAQFYRHLASGSWSNAGDLEPTTPEPLFLPSAVPALAPYEVNRWEVTEDRGPYAAGLLTMAIFLAKHGSDRGRANILYQTFWCGEFVAGANTKLEPSTEPDLTKRPGCATCHGTLEPLATYFARIVESDWTYLPASSFPVSQPECGTHGALRNSPMCVRLYDPDFTTEEGSLLRHTYSAPEHADIGPPGMAAELTESPAFVSCAASRVASSFLGRYLSSNDGDLQDRLEASFTSSGFRMRALVREIVTSRAYQYAHNLSSEDWRTEETRQ